MNIIKYLTNRKYRLFYKKIKAVQDSIWEYDFKVAKSRQVREGVRQDRDRNKEAQVKISAAIETTKKDDPNMEKLVKDLEQVTSNVGRFEAQMKMIDDQITGVPAHGEDPGQQGILDTIQSLAELREMYRDYLSKI